jgi:uncharacterized membrane protein
MILSFFNKKGEAVAKSKSIVVSANITWVIAVTWVLRVIKSGLFNSVLITGDKIGGIICGRTTVAMEVSIIAPKKTSVFSITRR